MNQLCFSRAAASPERLPAPVHLDAKAQELAGEVLALTTVGNAVRLQDRSAPHQHGRPPAVSACGRHIGIDRCH